MKKFIVLLAFIAFFSIDAMADKTNVKWLKDIDYDVRQFSNSRSAFKQDGRWGFMDGNARIVVKPVYEDCHDFVNGYAAVKEDGMWGYIDRSGTVVISPEYQEAGDFNEDGLAIVRKGEKYGVINAEGAVLSGIMFDEIGSFSDGFALARSSDLQYLLDDKGDVHNIDKGYFMGNFSEGMAPVQNMRTGKWGFVNRKGYLVIDMKYDTVYSFSNNIALVKHRNEYLYLSKEGRRKRIEGAAGQPLKFVNGFAKISTATGVGFIGKDLKLLTVYGKDASDFNQEGLAALELETGELVYVSRSGRIQFKADYDRIGNFNNGLAWVYKNGKYGYINTKGELVIDTLFTTATDFRDSVAFVSTKDRYGCIRYTPGYKMPEVSFTSLAIKDGNANGKVEADEEFDIHVTVRNPGREELRNVHVSFVNQVDQESWFTYDSTRVDIPLLRAFNDTTIIFHGKADISIMSSDVAMRFIGTSDNTLNGCEHTMSFEAVGIKASKPVISRYWVYKDDHSPVSGGKLNLLLTVKNDGKDPARAVNVNIQMPKGTWTDQPLMTIPELQPGEERDISTVFHMADSLDVDQQTIVARISDITQQHNRVEYITYTVGTANSEVRLDGTGLMFNMAQFAANAGLFAGAQMVAAQSEGVGKEAFVSELLKDIKKVAPVDDNKYALIFGNEDYNMYNRSTVQQQDVDYAVADAEAFRQYVINYMGVPEKNHIMGVNNGTRTQMLREIANIKELAETKGGEAEIYIFYAGHGQPAEESGDTYLIPADVPLTDAAAGIKLDDFYNDIANINAKKKLVFLDACYSGQGRAGRIELVLDEPSIRGNMMVFTATNSKQKSMPYKEKRHGMFTYYLLNTIKEAEGNITLNDLFTKTHYEVVHSSINVNYSKQEPELIKADDIDPDWMEWMLY
ncbi:MAG: WG repeat-containing protein [Bacteroidales bacterium]|nr:WG repeat-containing protein [Bacteroidales bacterium]